MRPETRELRELVEKRQDEGRKLFNPAMMLALKRGKEYPKKHGSIAVYKDEILEVRYDTYEPNLCVNVNGQTVLDFHSGHIKKFLPDSWVNHLIEIAEPILEEEDKRKIEEERKRDAEYLANWGITE